MENFRNRKVAAALAPMLLASSGLAAQAAEPMQDFMRQTGKINVVVAVIVVIFIGLATWLWRLDSKLTKLEHQIFQDNER